MPNDRRVKQKKAESEEIVGIGDFSHVVAGSVDVFYLVGLGQKSPVDYLVFMFPVLLGNIIGGSSIVAAIAHAQYVGGGEGKPA
ncbi:MAG: hypothetical protein ACREIF_15560 [Chthoniobacterales bacterium]